MKSIYTYSAKQSKVAIILLLSTFWAGFALGLATVLILF
jgi:hypothetical protein